MTNSPQSDLLARSYQETGNLDQLATRSGQESRFIDHPLAQEDLMAALEDYQRSWSASTLRSYGSDWRDFQAYCEDREISPFPAYPEIVVAAYISALSEGKWGEPKKLSTIMRRIAAIGHIHREAGQADPSQDVRVRRVAAGIRRKLSVRQERKEALRTEDIVRMVSCMGKNPRGVRDKALILIGFATACRRSELCSMLFEDVRTHKEGISIEVRKSKSDQEGKGIMKLIRMGSNPATCPVRALQEWTRIAGISSGPLFRSVDRAENVKASKMSEKGVSIVIKRAAIKAGLNPETISPHSLRAGYITEQDARQAKASDIMRQSGHSSPVMLATYTRYNLDEELSGSTALDLGL